VVPDSEIKILTKNLLTKKLAFRQPFCYTSNGYKMVLFLQENLPICPRFQYNLNCGFGYVGYNASFTDVNGNSYNNYSVAPASSFYIDAPTSVSLSASQTGKVT